MKKFTVIMLLILGTFESMAQFEFRDRFYIGLVSSYYIDFISSPLKIVNRSTEIEPGLFTPDTAVPYQTRYLAYFSFGLEPRLNILEPGDNFAIAIASPFTIGFGQGFPHNDEVDGAYGIGNFQIPLLAKMYLGSTSTYKSTDDIGLSIGAGFEYNKVALFNTAPSPNEDNKGWVMPVFSGSFHFWRGNSPLEVSVKYGFGREKTYYFNKDGGALLGGSRTTRASSLKLSFVYLLDY